MLSLDLLLLGLKYEPVLPHFLKALEHFEPNPVCEQGEKSFISPEYCLSPGDVFSG